MKLILSITLSLFFVVKGLSQKSSSKCEFIGTWNLCHPSEPTEPCYKGLMTYTFKKDGSYELRGVRFLNVKDTVLYGFWEMENRFLKLISVGADKKLYEQKLCNITMLSESRFYSVEEPFEGWKLYTLFQKVDTAEASKEQIVVY